MAAFGHLDLSAGCTYAGVSYFFSGYIHVFS